MGDPRGAVSAGHEATADAAAQVLAAGGGALDAAIAAVWAACVAEPILTGPLGAGLLLYAPADGEPVLLDFFARTPGLGLDPPPPARGTHDLDFVAVDVDFGPAAQLFHIGRGSAATPGTVSGMFHAHERWGRLPMADLVAPACRLARQGVPVTGRMAQMMRFLEPILIHTPEVRRLYAPDGELLSPGGLFKNEELADTFDLLASQGPGVVYGGAVGHLAVQAFGSPHGLLTQLDLTSYQPTLRTPLVLRYRGCEAILPPPPTAGGPLVAHGLSKLASQPPGAGMLAFAAAMRATDAARADVLGASNHLGSTTHISVVDGAGDAVSVTTSNGESCGYLVPGTGIAMNNFLGEEDINPSGFHAQRPGEGMLTMMCPTVLRHADGRTSVMGSGGSNRIRSAVLRVIAALADNPGLPLAAAVELPRLHVEGDLVNVEASGTPEDVLATLDATFSTVVRFPEPNMFFGGVHCVRTGLVDQPFEGAGDDRRGGVFRIVGDP